jgi:hypothetical protein
MLGFLSKQEAPCYVWVRCQLFPCEQGSQSQIEAIFLCPYMHVCSHFLQGTHQGPDLRTITYDGTRDEATMKSSPRSISGSAYRVRQVVIGTLLSIYMPAYIGRGRKSRVPWAFAELWRFLEWTPLLFSRCTFVHASCVLSRLVN